MFRIVAVAVAALLLTGCASAESPAPTAMAPVTSTPMPTEEVSTAPMNSLGLACTDIMPDDELALLFGEVYTPASESSQLTEPHYGGPHFSALRSAGGVTCTWGNGLGVKDQVDPLRDRLEINLLPGTTAATWAEYASVYRQDAAEVAIGDGSASHCNAGFEYGCYANILVGDVWIELKSEGLPDNTTEGDLVMFVRPVLDRLVDRVTAAVKSAVPSPTAIEPRTDCEAILPVDGVRNLLGITEEGIQAGTGGEGGGGLSYYQHAQARAGYTVCRVGPSRRDFSWASAEYLPGGAWAFEPTAVEEGAWDSAELVDVVGADTAYLTCPLEGTESCSVDMAVGSSWVSVGLTPADGAIKSGDRAHVLDLAALVAANLG